MLNIRDEASLRRAAMLRGLVFVATGVWLGLAGMWRMFAHFPGYDDEGYILLTVQNYLDHGGLYGRVYSQYGPAFYVLHDLVHRVTGVMADHAFARWFTLAMWLGAAAGSAGLVRRATRAAPAAWFAGVAVFLYLHQFSEEAFHPGAVIVFLLPGLLWLLQELLERGRMELAAGVAGAGVAVLALLKINVGALFAAGLMVWALLTYAGKWRRLAGIGAGLLFAAALMQGLLKESWVQVFLFMIATGLSGLALTLSESPRPGNRVWPGFMVGALGASLGTAAVVMSRGTSFAELLEGVIIRPLQHAGSYSYAVDWRPGTLPLALISLVVLAGFRSWRQSGRASAAQGLLVGLRLLLLTGVLAVVALLETHRVIGVLFSYVLPWLWVWVVPLREPAGETARPDARPLLACVLLLQALHGYPVGGSQLIWGSFLLFPLVALALPETGAWLATRGPSLRRVAGLTAILPVAVVAAKAGWATRGWHDAYEQRVALALPGTEGLRLGEREVLAYQTLVLNSVLHADRLFSLPGMFSFNLWSGVATPTLRNTTLWYALLTEAEQREIIAALEQSRRPALVVDTALIGILHHSGAPPTGPLYTYLLANFNPAFAFHGLGFWVRQGRLLLPAGTAWRLPDNGHGYHIALSGLDTPVERIELRDADRPDAGRLIMDGRNSRVAIQPVNLDGTPRAAAVEAVWPLRIDGPVWITIRSSDLATFVPGAASVLEFKSAAGQRLTAALAVDAK